MTTMEEMAARVERDAAKDNFRNRPRRMRSSKRRLCRRPGCYQQALGAEAYCLLHQSGINPLTKRETLLMTG